MLASPYRNRCVRVLLELPDGLDPAGVRAEADDLLQLLEQAPRLEAREVSVLLHGEGSSAWPALLLAGRLAGLPKIRGT